MKLVARVLEADATVQRQMDGLKENGLNLVATKENVRLVKYTTVAKGYLVLNFLVMEPGATITTEYQFVETYQVKSILNLLRSWKIIFSYVNSESLFL